jgi:hypothetical protein
MGLAMRALSPTEVHARSVEALGLDPSLLDLSSVEAIACALRRAAGFVCPCPERTLIRAVFSSLQGLSDDAEKLRNVVSETLELLIIHGDLLELHDADGRALIYTAPPSFVRRRSGAIMLLGVAPDNMSSLPDEIECHIQFINHVRILGEDIGIDIGDRLSELGLIELPDSIWLKLPKKETSAEYLARMDNILAEALPAGDVSGLVLLDSKLPVRYYPGRWVESTNQTGRFVGRRSQAYGANLWCYVEISQGRSIRLVDFPLRESSWRGCDEAWRLQAAIDYERGAPQLFRVRPGPKESRLIDLFSPVPMWAIRRWDAIGEIAPTSGCLFSYKFSEKEIDEELSFAKDHLWLVETH